MFSKQSTARAIIVGPILDSAGVEYASAVIGDLSISKNGGTLTAMASAATLVYIANGMYTLTTTTGNTDTLGWCHISVNKATYQMPPIRFLVMPATVFDALITNATNTAGGLIGATGGNVIRLSPSGVTTQYAAASDTNAARATAFLAAQTAASSGDRIIVNSNCDFSSVSAITKTGLHWTINPGVKLLGPGSGLHVVGDATINQSAAITVTVAGGGVLDGNDEGSAICSSHADNRIWVEAEVLQNDTADHAVIYADEGIVTVNTKRILAAQYDAIWSQGTAITIVTADSIIAGDNALETGGNGGSLVVRAGMLSQVDVGSSGPVVRLVGDTNVDLRCNLIKLVNAAATYAIDQLTVTATPKVLIEASSIIGPIRGERMVIRNAVIDTTANAIASLTLTGSNVILENCEIVTKSTETYSITAASAMTLTVRGGIKMNKAVHANVTIVYEQVGEIGSLGMQAKSDVNAECDTAISDAGLKTPGVLQSTTIATLASQTSFTLTAGSADNDAFNNAVAIFVDQSTATQKAFVRVSDYVGGTRGVTLEAAPAFTIAVGDSVHLVAGTGLDARVAAISAELVGNVTVTSPIADDGTLTLYNRRTYSGTAHAKIYLTVAKDYQAATSISLIVYKKGDPDTEYATYPCTATTETNIDVDSMTVDLDTLDYDECEGVFECRYSFVASWSGSLEEIAGDKAFVYDKPE